MQRVVSESPCFPCPDKETAHVAPEQVPVPLQAELQLG